MVVRLDSREWAAKEVKLMLMPVLPAPALVAMPGCMSGGCRLPISGSDSDH